MILDVLYSCNELYIEQAGISLLSLCKQNYLDFEEIRIHFVEDHISSQAKDAFLQTVQSFHAKIFFYPLEEWIEPELSFTSDSHHPISIYSKIFCGRLPVEHRLLYIDCDCIITDSLKELWTLDMKDNMIAGVLMPYSTTYKSQHHLQDCNSYICDGVVLFNLPLWRKYHCEEKCLSYIQFFHGMPPMMSEGTLNYICRDHILALPPKYNMMGHLFLLSTDKIKAFYQAPYYKEEERQDALMHPVIIHYIREFYERPWFFNSDHPKYSLYQQYKKDSLWSENNPRKGNFSIKHKFTKKFLSISPKFLLVILGYLREWKQRIR